MKDSPHHRKHLKKKAIKEANEIRDSGPLPEDMIENPDFKKQFDAKVTELPHKHRKHRKKRSKRASTEEVHEITEPDHANYDSERWSQIVQNQSKQRTKDLNYKLSKKFKKTG